MGTPTREFGPIMWVRKRIGNAIGQLGALIIALGVPFSILAGILSWIMLTCSFIGRVRDGDRHPLYIDRHGVLVHGKDSFNSSYINGRYLNKYTLHFVTYDGHEQSTSHSWWSESRPFVTRFPGQPGSQKIAIKYLPDKPDVACSLKKIDSYKNELPGWWGLLAPLLAIPVGLAGFLLRGLAGLISGPVQQTSDAVSST